MTKAYMNRNKLRLRIKTYSNLCTQKKYLKNPTTENKKVIRIPMIYEQIIQYWPEDKTLS